jgi:hypothetical protein
MGLSNATGANGTGRASQLGGTGATGEVDERVGPPPAGLRNASLGPRNPATGRKGDEAGFPIEVERDHQGRPLILKIDPVTGVHPVDDQGEPIRIFEPYTRASSMGAYAEDQRNLGLWRAAVALWGAFRARRDSIRIAVMAIRGYDDKADKQALYGLVERAQRVADIDAAADHGTALHAIFEQHDQGVELPPIGADQPALDAYAAAMTDVEVLASETFVVLDTAELCGQLVEVRAAGTFDRLVTVRRPVVILSKRGKVLGVLLPGDRIIVDIKTGSTADWFGVKYRLQCWIYANGRYYNPTTGERTPTGARTDWALILHVPAGGDSATWHWVDLRGADKLCQVALDVREQRNAGKRSIWPADLGVEAPDDAVEAELARREAEGDPRSTEPTAADLRVALLRSIAAEVAVCTTRAELVEVYGRFESDWGPDAQRIVEDRTRQLGMTPRRKAA